MNRPGQCDETTTVRRVGKSSDPDHPFHPCDDVDSDDPIIEAMLDSSTSSKPSSEADYDPAYPYLDPYTACGPDGSRRHVASRSKDVQLQFELSREAMDALVRAHDESVAALASTRPSEPHHAHSVQRGSARMHTETPACTMLDGHDDQAIAERPKPVAPPSTDAHITESLAP
eukprot:2180950-Pleurochrysis_carterae.AAC.1